MQQALLKKKKHKKKHKKEGKYTALNVNET